MPSGFPLSPSWLGPSLCASQTNKIRSQPRMDCECPIIDLFHVKDVFTTTHFRLFYAHGICIHCRRRPSPAQAANFIGLVACIRPQTGKGNILLHFPDPAEKREIIIAAHHHNTIRSFPSPIQQPIPPDCRRWLKHWNSIQPQDFDPPGPPPGFAYLGPAPHPSHDLDPPTGPL